MSSARVVPCRSTWLLAAVVTVVACAAAGRLAGPSASGRTPRADRDAPAASAKASPSASPAATEAAAGASHQTADPAQDAPPPIPSAIGKPDVAYWATPQPVVEKMLKLARVTENDVVYDLGCGDGRSLVTAAQRYGARGVGFDIDSRRVFEARRNVRDAGVEHLVRIEEADIFTVDVSPATVVFLYLVPRLNLRLVPQLEKLRAGSRIVSHEYEIPTARPSRIVHVRGPPNGPPGTDPDAGTVLHKIYLWKVPWQKQATEYSID
jgi:SAM-dependent methyltransferase